MHPYECFLGEREAGERDAFCNKWKAHAKCFITGTRMCDFSCCTHGASLHAKDPMPAHYIRSIRIDDLGKRRVSSKKCCYLTSFEHPTLAHNDAPRVGNRTNIRVLVMKHFVWIFRQDSICYYKTYSLYPLLSPPPQKAHTNAFCGSSIHHPNLYKYIMFLFNFPGVS